MLEFTPEDRVGLELKNNLIQELKNRFNCVDDAQDIAEFIVILIVSHKSPAEILQEVKEISEIPIDIAFIESILREIERIQASHNQPSQQLQPPQVPAHQNESSPPQPVQVHQAPPAPSNAPISAFPGNAPPFFPAGPFPGMDMSQMPPIPTIPTGPKSLQNSRNYDSRAGKGGRGGITKGNARNGQDKFKKGGPHNAQIMNKVLGNINAGNTNITQFTPKPTKGRCQDFPYCNNKECEFAHPTKNCFSYPNCPNPPGTCNYLHPDQDQELIAKLEKSKQEYRERKKNEALVTQASCKFGSGCTKDTCPFAHPTPANGSAKITTLDWCPAGKGCIDSECFKAHPPPPTAKPVTPISSDIALEQCKFGPQCTNYKCPRRHATSLVPCRAGSSCKRLDCTFAHPIKEDCRFGTNCQNKNCLYQHPSGREIQSNTWSKDSADTSNRAFAVPQDQVMEQAVQD